MITNEQSEYLASRARNNAYWTDRAIQHGSNLSATASTGWVRAAVLRRLRRLVKRGSSVLEVGCGNASSLLAPLSCHRKAYGIDLTMEMLSSAKLRHKEVRGLIRSDACRIPFQDSTFDYVYTSRCLINVLDPEMQRAGIREAFRVVRPNGTVILVENFEEPIARLNRAKRRYRAGPNIRDSHNLALSLQDTLAYCNKLGWKTIRIQGNTLASFMAHIIVWRLTAGFGGRIAEWVLSPVYLLLTWLDTWFGARLPLLGKDVLVAFQKA